MSESITRMPCVDSTPPDDITALSSGTHDAGVWSARTRALFQWERPEDRGCAGIGGFTWSVSPNGPTSPPRRTSLTARATSVSAQLRGSPRPRFFDLRAA